MMFKVLLILCVLESSLSQDGGFWWKSKTTKYQQEAAVDNRAPKSLSNNDYLEVMFGKSNTAVRQDEAKQQVKCNTQTSKVELDFVFPNDDVLTEIDPLHKQTDCQENDDSLKKSQEKNENTMDKLYSKNDKKLEKTITGKNSQYVEISVQNPPGDSTKSHNVITKVPEPSYNVTFYQSYHPESPKNNFELNYPTTYNMQKTTEDNEKMQHQPLSNIQKAKYLDKPIEFTPHSISGNHPDITNSPITPLIQNKNTQMSTPFRASSPSEDRSSETEMYYNPFSQHNNNKYFNHQSLPLAIYPVNNHHQPSMSSPIRTGQNYHYLEVPSVNSELGQMRHDSAQLNHHVPEIMNTHHAYNTGPQTSYSDYFTSTFRLYNGENPKYQDQMGLERPHMYNVRREYPNQHLNPSKTQFINSPSFVNDKNSYRHHHPSSKTTKHSLYPSGDSIRKSIEYIAKNVNVLKVMSDIVGLRLAGRINFHPFNVSHYNISTNEEPAKVFETTDTNKNKGTHYVPDYLLITSTSKPVSVSSTNIPMVLNLVNETSKSRNDKTLLDIQNVTPTTTVFPTIWQSTKIPSTSDDLAIEENFDAYGEISGHESNTDLHEEEGCVCVYYFLCDDGVVNVDGKGMLDLRFSACPENDYVCCKLPKTTTLQPEKEVDILPNVMTLPTVFGSSNTNVDEVDAVHQLWADIDKEETELDTGKVKSTTEADGCVCVYSYLCDDGKINIDGVGLLDMRFSSCPDEDEVCCILPRNHTKSSTDLTESEGSVEKPNTPALKQNSPEQTLDDLFEDVFGVKDNEPEKKDKEIINSEEDGCDCVYDFLCADGLINTDGKGLIDMRFNSCPEENQVCCKKLKISKFNI